MKFVGMVDSAKPFNLSILECKFKLYCKAQFGYDDF